MNKFEKLGLDKFKGSQMSESLTKKITGGACTGGGFRLVGTSSTVQNGTVHYTSHSEEWSSDESDGCGGTKYHDVKVVVHEYDRPMA